MAGKIWTSRECAELLRDGYQSYSERHPERTFDACRVKHGELARRGWVGDNFEVSRSASNRNMPLPDNVLLSGAVFDIETTDFKATGHKGHLVCCSILPLADEEPYTIAWRFGEHTDERLLADVINALAEYDILIGHNIAAFDLGWLASRRAYWRMAKLPGWLYFDTYQQAAKVLAVKAENKRLAGLCDYYGLPCIKTGIQANAWHNIRSRYRPEFDEAIQDIIYHCEQDVIANRQLFNIIYKERMDLHVTGGPLKQTKW